MKNRSWNERNGKDNKIKTETCTIVMEEERIVLIGIWTMSLLTEKRSRACQLMEEIMDNEIAMLGLGETKKKRTGNMKFQ